MSAVRGRVLAKFIVAGNWLIFGTEVYLAFLLWVDAVVNIGVSKIFIEIFGPILSTEKVADFNELLGKTVSILMVYSIVITGRFLCEILLNILLTVAVIKSDSRKLAVWLVIDMIFLIFRTFFLLHTLLRGETCDIIVTTDIVKTTWLALSLIAINYFRETIIQTESRDNISRGSNLDKESIDVQIHRTKIDLIKPDVLVI